MKKYLVAEVLWTKMPLLMSEIRGEWADWLEMIERATVTLITTRYNQDMQNIISEHTTQSNPEADGLQQQKITPGPLLSVKTAHGGYNSHRITKTGQYKIEKNVAGLMSLDFCCNIEMVGSEFGVKNIKAWIHPALSQRFRLLVV